MTHSKSFLTLVAAVAAASSSLASADIVDLSGLEFWGTDGDPGNGTRSFQLEEPGPIDGFGYIILEIQYDLTIQAFPGSSFDNLNIRFGNTDGTFDGSWPDSFQPALGNPGDGILRFTGSFFTDIHLTEDGLFQIELFESFDDGLQGPDAILLAGSTLNLIRFIPTPGTANLLLFGALITGTRRRR